MITLDSSAVIALLDRRDSNHARAVATLSERKERRVVPAAALGEIGHFIERLYGQGIFLSFIGDILTGAYLIDPGLDSFDRIRHLIERYQDLPLGLVDAAVIACAERNGGAVAREGSITLVQ